MSDIPRLAERHGFAWDPTVAAATDADGGADQGLEAASFPNPLSLIAGFTRNVVFDEVSGTAQAWSRVTQGIPSTTKAAAVFLKDYHLYFKDRNQLRDRPFGDAMVSVGFPHTRLPSLQVEVDCQVLLRDVNGDDAWGAEIRFVVLCFGL